MAQNTLQVFGEVQLLGVRTLSIKEITYEIADVYVEGQGSASVFLDKRKPVDMLSGFTVGVYQGRLSVVPVYSDVKKDKK
jgi:hypothetical protein